MIIKYQTMKNQPLYKSPNISIFSFEPEGVLCKSGGNEQLEENPGTEWDSVGLLD